MKRNRLAALTRRRIVALKVGTIILTILIATLAFVATASASGKQLWYHGKVDQIGSDIAGVSVHVNGEDDWTEWAYFLAPDDPYAVLGFTYVYAPATSFLYHQIFVNPDMWRPILAFAQSGSLTVADYTTAKAIFTLTHEAYHHRLYSSDEGRVNACALKAFPDVLTHEFGVAPTITTTTTEPVQTRVRLKYRVQSHGRWVVRYRWKVAVTYQQVLSSSPNPVFDALVADANAFYAQQPASYNTGTCW
jgi:hypothetical protein